MIYTGHPI